MRRQIVAANWKMNGSTGLVHELVPTVRDSVASLDNAVEVVIMPPSVFLGAVKGELSGSAVALGIQNIACREQGAYTGEVSADMAAGIGCDYALVGHSERRQLFGETDEVVAEKVVRGLGSGLKVMLCVGETLEEREAGEAESVVCRQVESALSRVSAEDAERVVVAYEPVWAIGTGRTATADDAQSMHQALRAKLSGLGFPSDGMSLLYGGSVKPDNAAALFAQPDIDGGLIGGASLNAEQFIAICQAAKA